MQVISPASIVTELIESAAMLADVPLQPIAHKLMWKKLIGEEIRITNLIRDLSIEDRSITREYTSWKRTLNEVMEIIYAAEMS